MRKTSQKGFTLIELMIALFLGMIIMVAVGQVYLMSTRTAVVQQSGSSILDANVFGLQQVERNLRLAGLDLAQKSSLELDQSGIITSVDNLKAITGFDAKYISVSDEATLPTSVERVGSDQLTIQYRAPTDILDCEGNLALGPRKAFIKEGTNEYENAVPVQGQVVIERYFLKDNGKGGLDLRCDAGRYAVDDIVEYEDTLTAEQQKAFEGNKALNKLNQPMGDDGALVTSDVDDFRVMFGVADGDNIQYLSPNEYKDAKHNKKAIVAVKIAILAKGNVPTVLNDLPDDPVFYMLGHKVNLKPATSKGYIRRVYESNSMLRNSREKK